MQRLNYILIGLVLCVFVLHTSAHAADKIRIGYPGPNAQFIPLQLAQSKGFLRDDRLDAELIRIASNVSIAALVNGNIDYYTVIGVGVQAAIQGFPVRVVACFVPAPPFMLIARPEFKSVRELKGKTIGIQSFGGPLMSWQI